LSARGWLGRVMTRMTMTRPYKLQNERKNEKVTKSRRERERERETERERDRAPVLQT